MIVVSGAGPAFAGTTGSLGGIVLDDGDVPVADAIVTAASPSQTASTKTGFDGRFTIVSLAPDSYALSVEKVGYEALPSMRIAIVTDQVLLPTLKLQKTLRTIAKTTSRSTTTAVVAPGITGDVYSIDARVSAAAQPVGGGGNQNTAYSAIAAVPGAFVPQGQQGWNQGAFIRGGRPEQTAFEYDGIPVNRSFDNAPVTTLSNLGLQQLQVYTGGWNAGTTANGTAGFINQVIKTGTDPGFANADFSVGAPAFYHHAQVEGGLATLDRNLRVYAGVSNATQDFRFIDQSNGERYQSAYLRGALALDPPAAYTLNSPGGVFPDCIGSPALNSPFAAPPGTPGAIPLPPGVANDPGCISTLSPAYGLTSTVRDAEGVINVHLALPHRSDSGHDDIQALYSASGLQTQAYSSPSDISLPLIAGFGTSAVWPDRLIFPPGTHFGQSAQTLGAVPYFYPGSPGGRSYQSPLPPETRTTSRNDAAVLKLQYQKNFSSNAFIRTYGYSLYSDFLLNGPTGFGLGSNPAGSSFGVGNYDYELSAHTRGGELQFVDQLGSHHLATLTANLVTSRTNRVDNRTYLNVADSVATNLTDGSRCYAYQDGATGGATFAAGDPAPCNSEMTSGTLSTPTRGGAPAVGAALAAGARWRVTLPAGQGWTNRVTPTFTSFGLNDKIRAGSKLVIDAGLRYDRFRFDLGNTTGAGRDFWFAAARRELCYNPVTLEPLLLPQGFNAPPNVPPVVAAFSCPVDNASGSPVPTVHPDGRNGHLLLSNDYAPTIVQDALEPRVGLTYQLGRDTVLRAAAGRYAQPPTAAFLVYNTQEPNLAARLFANFWKFGYTTPRHDVPPQFSSDVDVSLEHHFAGSDVSLKVTPYYRYATNQSVDLSTLDGLGSAVPAATERDIGVEFLITKGDFAKNGWSGRLALTHLNSKTRFQNFPGSSLNLIDQNNQLIIEYNALTQAGGGAACYANSADGTPDPACAPTSIRNPYYRAARQPLLDRNALYPTGLNLSYLSPNTLTLLANWRHDRFWVAPSMTLDSGQSYGGPGAVLGVDPRTCSNNSSAMVNSPIAMTDPLRADYTSCGVALTPSGSLNIPNPQTGSFTNFGAFTEPWQFNANIVLGYDVTTRTKATVTVSNLFNSCFGGSSTPWSHAFRVAYPVCSFYANPGFYVSNFYNGTSPKDIGANGVPLKRYVSQSYAPIFFGAISPVSGAQFEPVSVYFSFKVSL